MRAIAALLIEWARMALGAQVKSGGRVLKEDLANVDPVCGLDPLVKTWRFSRWRRLFLFRFCSKGRPLIVMMHLRRADTDHTAIFPPTRPEQWVLQINA